MRHAILIMGNSNPAGVRFVCQQLKNPQIDFFVHWDATSKINIDKYIGDLDGVRLLKKPVNVSWGGSSQVEAQLKLLEAAGVDNDTYDYYHLISDNDVALMDVNHFLQFFKENSGKEFIGFEENDDSRFGWKSRVQYYYPFENLNINRNLKKVLELTCVVTERFFRVDRLKKNRLKICKGSSWYSISKKTARYVLSKKAQILKLCKMGSKVDEIYLQSLINENKKLKSDLYSGDEFIASLRYIDWKRGNPYVFNDSDLKNIQENFNQKYAFLRKINIEKSPKIKNFLKNDEILD